MGEIAVDIGFSSNIFMVFGLPTRRLLGNPAFWTKKSSLCNLTIARDEKYEIPFGCYARMNQIFIDTEVRSKNTNVIDVGQSFREYTEKLGYSSGKANKALVQQLLKEEVVREVDHLPQFVSAVSKKAIEIKGQGVALEDVDHVHVQGDRMFVDVVGIFFLKNDLAFGER